MNDFAHPDLPPVYHDRPNLLTRLAQCFRRRLPADAVPRVFALLRDDEDGDAGLVAWGMRLPDGTAVTVGGGRKPTLGKWSSADRAARLHHADLDWL